MKAILIILLGCLSMVFCNENPHDFFIARSICEIVSTKTVDLHYNLIRLKCDWNKFVEATEDKNRYFLEKPTTSKLDNLYEIELIKSTIRTEISKYRTIGKRLFTNFHIKTLVMRDLEISSIDDEAFEKDSFYNYLEVLDLSQNNLRRIDSHALENLNYLNTLNLSFNQLNFGEHNFKYNKLLRYVDLSDNGLQFLTPNLFFNLHDLRTIDLKNNNIKNVDACTFTDVQKSPITLKYAPTTINLSRNPISCDCNVFYLNRHLGYKLNLTCSKPDYYSGRAFNELVNEDPSYRCEYSSMQKSCNKNTISTRDLTLIIVFASLTGFFLIVTCCCCCKNSILSGEIDTLNETLRRTVKKTPPKKIYVDSSAVGQKQQNGGDKEKLIKE